MGECYGFWRSSFCNFSGVSSSSCEAPMSQNPGSGAPWASSVSVGGNESEAPGPRSSSHGGCLDLRGGRPGRRGRGGRNADAAELPSLLRPSFRGPSSPPPPSLAPSVSPPGFRPVLCALGPPCRIAVPGARARGPGWARPRVRRTELGGGKDLGGVGAGAGGPWPAPPRTSKAKRQSGARNLTNRALSPPPLSSKRRRAPITHKDK